MTSTGWSRRQEGWVRGDWLARKAADDSPESPHWELCRRGADGEFRALNDGPTARGMMDFADIRDGV